MKTLDSPFATATTFLAPLWATAVHAISLAPDRPICERSVFSAAWLADRPLPVADERQPGQTVALADGDVFIRADSADDVAQGYQDRPRTRVYESLHVRSDSWVSLATLYLAGLLRREVVCTAYESLAGDRNLGPHDDAWTGLIVQFSGVKRWLVWPIAQAAPQEIVMRAGDVMVLPHGMKHDVSTPDTPGHSMHLVFAVTNRPIDPRPEAFSPSTS